MMWCMKCDKRFPDDCVCKDRDERLRQLGRHLHLALRVCATCDKHADLCCCPIGPTIELWLAKPV